MLRGPARYDTLGQGYSRHRRPDPRIARVIAAALGEARTVVNVGAGTGSYEPADRTILAVEPSRAMIAQRAAGAPPVVQAAAEALPFRDRSFDASLAVLTLHHWLDPRAGLTEMLRVSRHRIVLVTWDPAHDGFWLHRDYLPEILAVDRNIFLRVEELQSILGSSAVEPLLIPHDCEDGFLGAYWRRPEAYLDASVRAAVSTFSRIGDVEPQLLRLRADLESGAWAARNEEILRVDALDTGYRVIVKERAV